MTLDPPVSPDFGGGSLPYDLNPLMGPRKVIDFQFVQLFLAVKDGSDGVETINFVSFLLCFSY